MNVPIRMLGIATSIFWIMLISVVALAAYSVKDLDFDFGEPQLTVAPDGELTLSLPLYINNRGYYSLKEFHLSTVFSDTEGAEISRDNTFAPVIAHGENTTILHNITLSMVSLLEKGEQYMFNDNSLNISVTAGLNFAELFPAQISTNFAFPWGAPFYNFALGEPSYEQVDLTQVTIAVPMSFENHALFDIAGNIKIEIYDRADSLVGESQTPVYVSQNSAYEGEVEFNVPMSSSSFSRTQNGYFNVYFDVILLEYGPLVIAYG
ncbi:MAG: hypothetical protein NWE84_02685 [Candidatus Bathyarchaeota archaeon]|nr:hypothetical protein [Candidatus Bathyarchaeota archaeon]